MSSEYQGLKKSNFSRLFHLGGLYSDLLVRCDLVNEIVLPTEAADEARILADKINAFYDKDREMQSSVIEEHTARTELLEALTSSKDRYDERLRMMATEHTSNQKQEKVIDERRKLIDGQKNTIDGHVRVIDEQGKSIDGQRKTIGDHEYF